ncbi:MAG: ribokinase [Anaerolineae bacterium]|nr:ribokinase [Anaerolineae bacterium]
MIKHTLKPVSYLVIGHITQDLLPGGLYAMGGTATYAALTAAALGHQVGIVTSYDCGSGSVDFGESVQIACQPARATTTFENRYAGNNRLQYLHARAEELTFDSIPEIWRNSPLVHIGPVAWECAPALVGKLAESAFVGITPQGWLRKMDSRGGIHYTRWTVAERVLPLASAVVLSIEDVAGDASLIAHFSSLARLLVVTYGGDGCVLFQNGRADKIPAPRCVEIDPTGAGDIFATAFFSVLYAGVAPIPAVRFATCLASHSVEFRNLDGIPQLKDVESCRSMKVEL